MSQIVAPLIIASLSGLAFVTYRHPEISQKLINVVLVILFSLFMVNSIFYTSRMFAFRNAKNAVDSVFDNKEVYFKKMIESRNENVNELLFRSDINISVISMKIDADKNIESLIDDDSSKYYNNGAYLFCALIVILIFYGLTLVFEKMHRENRKKSDN